MATYPRLNRLLQLIDRAPSAFDLEPASTPPAAAATADPLVATLINNGAVLEALDTGEGLTTGQVLARLGLLPTGPLQLRMARALGELGYFHVTLRSSRASPLVKVWLPVRPEPPTMPPAQPVSDFARRVHTPARPRTGLTEWLIRTLFERGTRCRDRALILGMFVSVIIGLALGWRP